MELIPFFLLLVAALLFSAIFRQFHLPWVVALIVAGALIGPSGFAFLELTPVLEFMAKIGLIFLMFMAGLETRLSSFREFRRGILSLSLVNSVIPFAVGWGIGSLFGFGLVPSLLLGIIFMSSSIAVIVPTLEVTGMMNTKLGKTIVSSTILQDVASLVLLSVLLQTVDPTTALPLPSFYILLAFALVAFRYGLPRLRALIPYPRDEHDLFQTEVRIIFAMLLGTVVVFEALGLHAIIAGFFAGLVLSDTVTSSLLIEKLRTISYGVFIPVFFVVVGAQSDIAALTAGSASLLLVVAVVLGSLCAKFLSGVLGARFAGFRKNDAYMVGFAAIPQLSTTLAVVFSAVELGLLHSELAAAMVLLSMVSTLVAPIAMRRVCTRCSQV